MMNAEKVLKRLDEQCCLNCSAQMKARWQD
jgi:hypothetical protein